MAAAGEKKAVSHTRKDLADMVKAVWDNIDHASISRTGYQQTGPLAPLEGPFHRGDFCRDLRDLLKLMCPHDDPQQIGTPIRDDAKKLVDDMWASLLYTSPSPRDQRGAR